MEWDERGVNRREVLGLALGAGMLGAAAAAEAQAEPKPRDEQTRRLLLIAGTQSHPPMQHEYNSGVLLLKQCLAGVPGLETRVALSGWPKDASVFDGVDAIFLYMDGGTRHYALKDDHMAKLGKLMDKGVGLGCCHYAVEVPVGPDATRFQGWMGGTYETNYSCNPIWKPEFTSLPKHVITRGVQPFTLEDEWYFNIRFRDDGVPVTPILTAIPSDKVRNGPYVSPRGPYDHIVRASGRPETMMWITERPDGGRGFGFTGAHYHKNWISNNFRKLVLNALLWIAKKDIVRGGVDSSITEEDLKHGLYGG
jgi:hypothetical protein